MKASIDIVINDYSVLHVQLFSESSEKKMLNVLTVEKIYIQKYRDSKV